MNAVNGDAAPADSVVIFDFETTGLSPEQGDRAIEIGAVRLEAGRPVSTFSELMDPGMRIGGYIEHLTGITNAMLAEAPPCGVVMARFADFVGEANLVAHNAAFDRRFLASEYRLIDREHPGGIGCTLLLARRLYQDAPSHALAELARHLDLRVNARLHRALADAELTSRLWLRCLADLTDCHGLTAPAFGLLRRLARVPRREMADWLAREFHRG